MEASPHGAAHGAVWDAAAAAEQKKVLARVDELRGEHEKALAMAVRDAVAEAMAQEVAPAVKQLNEVVGTLNKAVSQDMVAALFEIARERQAAVAGGRCGGSDRAF